MTELAIETKTCTKCGESKPLSDFNLQGDGRGGRRGDCKSCQHAHQRAYYEANRAKVRAAAADWYARNTERGRQNAKNWKRRNRDRVRALEAAREQRLRDERNRRRLAWILAHPEIVRQREIDAEERRRAEVARRGREWRRANPDKRKAQKLRHRCAKAAAAGADYTTAALIAGRFEVFGGLCRYCSQPATEIDHRIPLSRGGSHWPSNLVPACRSCNARKNSKTELEFLALLEREGVKPNPHGRTTDSALI